MATSINSKILRIWELAAGQHPVDRAITVMQELFPERSWDDLARCSIGKRNDLLLTIREQIFGKELHGSSKCSECGKALEFIADVDEFRVPSEPADQDAVYELESAGYRIRVRLLNSLDLAAIADCDVETGRRLLARRAVQKLSREAQQVTVDELPDEAIAAISQTMAVCDPQANMDIDLECPECHRDFSIPFDIGSFLWREINAQAKRLLREVEVLARYFGWREADILAMTSVRRHQYLAMVEG